MRIIYGGSLRSQLRKRARLMGPVPDLRAAAALTEKATKDRQHKTRVCCKHSTGTSLSLAFLLIILQKLLFGPCFFYIICHSARIMPRFCWKKITLPEIDSINQQMKNIVLIQ